MLRLLDRLGCPGVEQNRPRVLRCPSALSPAARIALRQTWPAALTGLLLKRVRADWRDRYGVEPLLVETYVDRSTHSGQSLAAAIGFAWAKAWA